MNLITNYLRSPNVNRIRRRQIKKIPVVFTRGGQKIPLSNVKIIKKQKGGRL